MKEVLVETCGHWMTRESGAVLVCVDCGVMLPAGWHDIDFDDIVTTLFGEGER